MFSQIYRGADPARMPGAADTNHSSRFIKRGVIPNVKISSSTPLQVFACFQLSMVSHDGFRCKRR
jgi:hypothetical protein